MKFEVIRVNLSDMDRVPPSALHPTGARALEAVPSADAGEAPRRTEALAASGPLFRRTLCGRRVDH